MKKTTTNGGAIQRPGRDTLRGLLGSRSMQLLLTAVAVGQGADVVERATAGEKTARAERPTQEQLVRGSLLPPVVVTGIELAEAPARKVEAPREDKAMALAAKYADEGYKVSPSLARTIVEAAEESGIAPETAFGLVRAESGFRTSATSPVGAVGLTQLMPKTAAWLEPGVTRSELRDPKTNLRIGFRYLKDLIEKYDGNERLALVAYNRGPGTVDRALKRGQNPDNGYADFVHGKADHGHTLYTKSSKKKRRG